MNARFNEVLNLLQQKNESVKQEKIATQSQKEAKHSDDVADFECHTNPNRQECDPSNVVIDDAGPTSTDSVGKKTDKSVEMEDDKANQAPSFLKKGEQHEKEVGIDKQSDIVVEEIQPLESIILGREHDLTLTIYKPPPTTIAECEISDTVILFCLFYFKKECVSWDCGVFVADYAGYLSEGLGIPCSGIEAQYHRLRYASVLCKYESEKEENRYFSKNDDPPRPRSKFAPKETDRVLLIK
ncbi:hypothetical protein BC332_04119 [Capsicum chinense]|nr:hypothetical protein BC332_04119 [Capsicum chinense]